MCKSNIDIHFCTCESEGTIIHNKNSRKFKKKFTEEQYLEKSLIWKLFKYKGYEDTGMIGMIVMPKNKLTNQITAEYLLAQLNSKNVFDFDYRPNEGDNLVVEIDYKYKPLKKKRRNHIYSYMSFIFKKSLWIEDHYNGFYDQTELIKKGKVKVNS